MARYTGRRTVAVALAVLACVCVAAVLVDAVVDLNLRDIIHPDMTPLPPGHENNPLLAPDVQRRFIAAQRAHSNAHGNARKFGLAGGTPNIRAKMEAASGSTLDYMLSAIDKRNELLALEERGVDVQALRDALPGCGVDQPCPGFEEPKVCAFDGYTHCCDTDSTTTTADLCIVPTDRLLAGDNEQCDYAGSDDVCTLGCRSVEGWFDVECWPDNRCRSPVENGCECSIGEDCEWGVCNDGVCDWWRSTGELCRADIECVSFLCDPVDEYDVYLQSEQVAPRLSTLTDDGGTITVTDTTHAGNNTIAFEFSHGVNAAYSVRLRHAKKGANGVSITAEWDSSKTTAFLWSGHVDLNATELEWYEAFELYFELYLDSAPDVGHLRGQLYPGKRCTPVAPDDFCYADIKGTMCPEGYRCMDNDPVNTFPDANPYSFQWGYCKPEKVESQPCSLLELQPNGCGYGFRCDVPLDDQDPPNGVYTCLDPEMLAGTEPIALPAFYDENCGVCVRDHGQDVGDDCQSNLACKLGLQCGFDAPRKCHDPTDGYRWDCANGGECDFGEVCDCDGSKVVCMPDSLHGYGNGTECGDLYDELLRCFAEHRCHLDDDPFDEESCARRYCDVASNAFACCLENHNGHKTCADDCDAMTSFSRERCCYGRDHTNDVCTCLPKPRDDTCYAAKTEYTEFVYHEFNGTHDVAYNGGPITDGCVAGDFPPLDISAYSGFLFAGGDQMHELTVGLTPQADIATAPFTDSDKVFNINGVDLATLVLLRGARYNVTCEVPCESAFYLTTNATGMGNNPVPWSSVSDETTECCNNQTVLLNVETVFIEGSELLFYGSTQHAYRGGLIAIVEDESLTSFDIDLCNFNGYGKGDTEQCPGEGTTTGGGSGTTGGAGTTGGGGGTTSSTTSDTTGEASAASVLSASVLLALAAAALLLATLV